MYILYISSLSSRKVVNQIYSQSGQNPGFAIQKFSRLIAVGMVKNDIHVTAFSQPPINRKNTKNYSVHFKEEFEDGVHYKYVPVINLPVIKNIVSFVYSFLFTLFWGIKGHDKAVLFDVLNISICAGGLLATKINRLKSVGIVTDMPRMMNCRQHSFWGQAISKINTLYFPYFTHYVFLTEAMNDVINIKKRPYIVMEGLVDIDDSSEEDNYSLESFENNEFKIMYAGGLYERYGLKMLVEAVMRINADVKLLLFGSGPMVSALNRNKNNKIVYCGIVPNSEVTMMEKKVDLLVNPRPTHEDFTKYSFPSKNMEYMLSGTPLLTTKLPGMPQDYYPYVYLVENESEEGFCEAIQSIMRMSRIELKEMGKKARSFVLRDKNNKCQANRILLLINSSTR